jgi:short-subunit dehydrogenase
MLSQNYGHIVNISSLAGKFGTDKRTSYCASKFGIIGMMDSLRVEVIVH